MLADLDMDSLLRVADMLLSRLLGRPRHAVVVLEDSVDARSRGSPLGEVN